MSSKVIPWQAENISHLHSFLKALPALSASLCFKGNPDHHPVGPAIDILLRPPHWTPGLAWLVEDGAILASKSPGQLPNPLSDNQTLPKEVISLLNTHPKKRSKRPWTSNPYRQEGCQDALRAEPLVKAMSPVRLWTAGIIAWREGTGWKGQHWILGTAAKPRPTCQG